MNPSEGEFVRERAKKKIGIKSALMEYAALERNLEVLRVSPSVLIIESPTGGRLPFSYMNGYLSSQVGRYLCDHKEKARTILNGAGLNVTPSRLFSRRDYSKAWEYARELNSPVVVKPTNLSRGRGITTEIRTEDQFLQAWDKAFGAYRNPDRARVLLERQVLGEDYRFYVIGDQTVFATQRKRASVTGDGQSTIAELIESKNLVRSKNPYLGTYLIPDRPELLDGLQKKGWSLSHVPHAGEEVTLRGASNLSAGGDSIDYTDRVHPGFREIVVRAVKEMPGMQYAGVDVIAPSITVAPDSDNYVISELENSPAPITHFPVAGQPRDMAGALLGYYLSPPPRARRTTPWIGKETSISQRIAARLRSRR